MRLRQGIAVGAGLVVLGLSTTGSVALAQDPGNQPDPAITDGSAQARLDAARATWRRYGARSYRMRVRITCFCPVQYTRPGTVEVRGGKIVRAGRAHRPIATVPRIFGKIQAAIDAKVTNLSVDYDARRGVPRNVFIDRSLMIADEEMGYGVLSFTRLSRSGGRR